MDNMVGSNINREIMKKYIFALAVGSMSLLSTSCQDDELIREITPVVAGSEVLFGGRAGFENSNPQSRTEYSGVDYKYNGKSYERIDWTFDKDMVEIYCSQGGNTQSSHYIVRSTNLRPDSPSSGTEDEKDPLNDYAYLERDGASSIQWGSENLHTFYGMYPSSEMFVNEDETTNTVDQGIKMEGTKVFATVPIVQQPSSIGMDDKGNWIVKPNMNYAYMVAKKEVAKDTVDVNSGVGISFVPIVTALEVELYNSGDESLYIGEIQVESDDDIAGDFSTDLKEWNPAKGYPVCTKEPKSVSKKIQITTRVEEGGLMKPLNIASKKSLKFTVFLITDNDTNNNGNNETDIIENLKISVSNTGAGYTSKTLNKANIPMNLKTRIKKLYLPTQTNIDASKWMAQIDSKTVMKRLSIPGTGGSFSYAYGKADSTYYRQQHAHMNLDAQWKLGIRAFEIVCNRNSSTSKSLGDEYVKCNKTSVGLQVKTVFDQLYDKVRNSKLDLDGDGVTEPSETAVLILTYQPEGSSPARNSNGFAQNFKAWFTELQSSGKAEHIIQYSPSTTMAEARGNILLILRLNQRDEPESSSLETAETNYSNALTTLSGLPVLVINGCGTGKDRWGARGYKLDRLTEVSSGWFNSSYTFTANTVAPDISNAYGGPYNYVEAFMKDGYIGEKSYSKDVTYDGTTYTVKLTRPTAMNFGFTTNTTTTCWFQEWARVIPSNMVYNGTYWFESYSEKLSNVNGTFDMAISNDPNYSSYVFINSLCGYLADTGHTNSVTPSTGYTYGGGSGNIKALAVKLNPAFYTHVLSSGLENATGPTGIILMDYVNATGSGTAHNYDDGSYYLPGMIISNNFKFGSASDNIGGSGQGTGQGGSGI